MSSPPLVVVANPAAGRGKAGRLIGKVDRLLAASGSPHEIRVSTSPAHLADLAGDAARDGARIVGALGGDGTVSIVADALLGTEAALLVLPAGTGDDFAASLGIGSIDRAVRQLASPRIERVDVVGVTAGAEQRHYVNVAGAGFDSAVNEMANDTRINLGATGTYVVSVLRTLSRFEPAAFRIELDDEQLEVSAMLVVVANAVSYGGGMKVAPRASLVDGLLDVCIIEAMSVPAFLRAFPRVFRGTHVDHPKVRTARSASVRIEADRRVQVYADGERVGPLPARFEVVPEALRVVVGPGAVAIR